MIPMVLLMTAGAAERWRFAGGAWGVRAHVACPPSMDTAEVHLRLGGVPLVSGTATRTPSEGGGGAAGLVMDAEMSRTLRRRGVRIRDVTPTPEHIDVHAHVRLLGALTVRLHRLADEYQTRGSSP